MHAHTLLCTFLPRLITHVEADVATKQSRECQKAHWKQHKQYCSANVEIQRTREALGGWIAERQRTFEKWCNKYSQSIASAALSALEIMKDRDRTGKTPPKHA